MLLDPYGNPVPDPYDPSMGGSAGGVGAPYTPNVPAYPGGSPDLSNQTSGGGIASTIGAANDAKNAKLRGALVPEDFKTGAKLSGETPAEPTAPAGNPAPTFVPFKRGPEVPAASSTGGMGGGGGGIDRSKLTDAEAALQGRYGEGASAERAKAANQTDVINFTSEQENNLQARKQRDAEDRQARDAIAFQKQREFLDRQEYLANDLANKKVDPSRLLRSADAATQFTIGLGATIAGGLAAMNKTDGNSSLDRLNKMIDRDIDAQKEDIKAGKASYDARNSLFTQMLAEHRDEGIAEDATRVLMYTATADKIRSDAARIGLPGVIATGEIAANKFETQAAELKYKMEKDSFDKKVSQAAAAVSAQRAAEQLKITNALAERKMRVEEGKLAVDQATASGTAAAQTSERFVPTGMDAKGNPTGYVAANADEAKEKKKNHAAAMKVLGLIDNALAVREEEGTTGRILNREVQGVYTPDWMTKLRSDEAQILTAWKETGNLGTLDAGTQILADKVIGNLGSVGGSSETRLRQLRDTIQGNIEKDTQAAGGQNAVKVIDPATGQTVIVRKGSINAPLPDYVIQGGGQK